MKQRRAICRVDVPVGGGAPPSRGTGALVGERLVVTALHVVADRKKSPPAFFTGPITLSFPDKQVAATPVAGRWDQDADWVLLECAEAPGIEPIPLRDLRPEESGLAWETFGFPDAKPDGMVMKGEVSDPDGAYQKVRAIQLYCQEAAAGDGAPVAGLSGSPCQVEGALVGVIRSALLVQGHSVAGTLFACPVAAMLAGAGALLRLPDPCTGLPGFLRRDLPAKPYRSLDFYTEADAEIFFGRAAAIKELYEKLTDPVAAPIVLFFGQSGVGKSSLLDAGIRPRLEGSYRVHLVRRDAARGLQACFEEATGGDLHALEAREGRPSIVILDQVEEAFTRPRGNPEDEIAELLAALGPYFGAKGRRPEGRLVLSLRKEWSPDLEAKLEAAKLPFSKVFLERLDRAGAIEVVHGLSRTERLQKHFHTTVEAHLGEEIADQLLSDYGSPVAPMLQILMTRLWAAAEEASPGAPQITREKYLCLEKQGLHLDDFLRQQIEGLSPEMKPLVDSGLVDDLLEAHTTPLGTTETLTRDALGTRYPQLDARKLDALLEGLKTGYLLTNPIKDATRDKARTRLGHDTLAPLVRERFRQSTRPGPRARRLLEGRAEGGDPLSANDLALVMKGLGGMRATLANEEVLLARSQARRRNGRIGAGLLAVVGLVATGVILNLYVNLQSEQSNSSVLERQKHVDEARRLFEQASAETDPVKALSELCLAVEVAPEDDPRLNLYIGKAQHVFAEVAPTRTRTVGEPIERAEVSRDWSRILTQDLTGAAWVHRIRMNDAEKGSAFVESMHLDPGDGGDRGEAHLSPDGRWVLTGSVGGPLTLWDAVTGRKSRALNGVEGAGSFDPGSRMVVAEGKGGEVAVVAVRHGESWALPDHPEQRSLGKKPIALADTGDRTLALRLASKGAHGPATITVIDASTGEPAFPAPIPLDGAPLQMALSPAGTQVAALVLGADNRTKAVVLQASTGKVTFEREGDLGDRQILGVDEGGESLILGHRDSFPPTFPISLSLLSKGVDRLDRGRGRCTVEVAPLVIRPPLRIGETVWCRLQGDEQDTVGLLGLSPGRGLLAVTVPKLVSAWGSPDGKRALSVTSDGWIELRRLDSSAMAERRLIDANHEPLEARFSASGSRLIVAESGSGRLRLFGGDRWEQIWARERSFGAQGDMTSLALSSDGEEVAATQGGQVLRWTVTPSSDPVRANIDGVVSRLVFSKETASLVVAARGERDRQSISVFEWAGSQPPALLGTVHVDETTATTRWGVALGAKERYFVERVEGTLRIRSFGGQGPAPVRLDLGGGAGLATFLLLTSPSIDLQTTGPSNVLIRVGTSPPVEILSILGQGAVRGSAGSPYLLSSAATHAIASRADGPATSFSAAGPWLTEERMFLPLPVAADPRAWDLVVRDLSAGFELAKLRHEHDLLASAYSPDGDRLFTVDKTGTLREWFIRQKYSKKPTWVANLIALVSDVRLTPGGAAVPSTALHPGPQRAAILAEIRAAAEKSGDLGAAFVLRHLNGAK